MPNTTPVRMKLHGFDRSSASFRVRIALNLKGIAYDTVNHDLARGAQRHSGYLAINPQGLLPALEDRGVVLTQSSAIIEYLDEIMPAPPLLPARPIDRARVRALAQIVAADTHHVTTRRVGAYLSARLGHDGAAVEAWQRHWLAESIGAFERLLAQDARTGRYCHGDTPTLADIFLVPQIVSAQRLGFDAHACPTVSRIVEACLRDPAFAQAHPDNASTGADAGAISGFPAAR